MKKGDFIRLKYSGKIKGADKDLDVRDNAPVIVGVGNIMKGVDEALLEMNVGDKKTIEVPPEKGFGKRDPKMIKLVPLSEFKRHGQKPRVGMKFNANGVMATVIAVSGGRVKVDFNHPLAGKTLIYNLEIKSKIENLEDKIKAILEFYYQPNNDAEKQLFEKVEIKAGDKAVEIILPVLMEINSLYKRKIAFDIMKYLDMDFVKFSEIFEKPKEKKDEELGKKDKAKDVANKNPDKEKSKKEPVQ